MLQVKGGAGAIQTLSRARRVGQGRKTAGAKCCESYAAAADHKKCIPPRRKGDKVSAKAGAEDEHELGDGVDEGKFAGSFIGSDGMLDEVVHRAGEDDARNARQQCGDCQGGKCRGARQ